MRCEKFVNPIADEFYEGCIKAAELYEKCALECGTKSPSIKIPYSGKDPAYKVVYSRLEGLKQGVIQRVWHEDPLLGTEEYRLIQSATGKLVLRVSEVGKVIEECFNRVGADTKQILEMAEDTYCGVSRDQVTSWLRRRNEQIYSVRTTEKNAPGTSHEDEEAIGGRDHQLLGKYRALPDDLYDCVARSLAGVQKLPKYGNNPLYAKTAAWIGRNKRFCRAEQLNEELPEAERNWVIKEKISGRIVVRESEVESLVLEFYDEQNGSDIRGNKSTSIVHDLIKKAYCGISAKRVQDILNRIEKEGSRNVSFPPKPKLETTRPMQHIQVDIVGMNETEYQGQLYKEMLVVQCLFSRFWFALPLQNKDRGLIHRHLMDILGTFGPPEAFQCYTDTPTVNDCMADVCGIFGISIPNMGRSGITEKGGFAHYALRKRVYAKTVELFGEDYQWAEALPYAVVEENQRLSPLLGSKLSPFEVMFGRQPWPGSVLPPWILPENGKIPDESTQKPNEYSDPDDGDVDYGLHEEETYWKRTLCTTQMKMYGERQREIRQSAYEMGQWRVGSEEPPTGILYCPGDQVFVKNPAWEDWEKNRKDPVARYFKGVITNRNMKRPFPYLVRWSQRKDANEFQEIEQEEWMSIYDIVGRTRDLESRRKIKAGSLGQKPAYICQCENLSCRAFASKACEHRMAKICCQRINGGCSVHIQPLFVVGNPSNEETNSEELEAEPVGHVMDVSSNERVGEEIGGQIKTGPTKNFPQKFLEMDLDEVEEIKNSLLKNDSDGNSEIGKTENWVYKATLQISPSNTDSNQPSTSNLKVVRKIRKVGGTCSNDFVDEPYCDWLSDEAVTFAKRCRTLSNPKKWDVGVVGVDVFEYSAK